jgi:hypothetical protein
MVRVRTGASVQGRIDPVTCQDSSVLAQALTAALSPPDFAWLAPDPPAMFWEVICLLPRPLRAVIGGLLWDDRDREILALGQQVLILQRQLGKGPHLLRAERLALLLACARMKRHQLFGSMMLVNPPWWAGIGRSSAGTAPPSGNTDRGEPGPIATTPPVCVGWRSVSIRGRRWASVPVGIRSAQRPATGSRPAPAGMYTERRCRGTPPTLVDLDIAEARPRWIAHRFASALKLGRSSKPVATLLPHVPSHIVCPARASARLVLGNPCCAIRPLLPRVEPSRIPFVPPRVPQFPSLGRPRCRLLPFRLG